MRLLAAADRPAMNGHAGFFPSERMYPADGPSPEPPTPPAIPLASVCGFLLRRRTAAGGGTNTAAASAPVASTARATASKIGLPSIDVPPAPGFVPPTTFVP